MTKASQSTKRGYSNPAKGKARPTRQEILEKLWYVFLALILVGVVGYTIYIQIIHHP